MSQTYRHISGADFAVGLETAHVTPRQFAVLYDVPEKRVARWLNDEVEIPHSVALFVGLIADPPILEKALIITRYMRDESKTAAAAERRRAKRAARRKAVSEPTPV